MRRIESDFMEIVYKQPKLKDKVYGAMFWEGLDEDEMFWYAPVKTAAGERFDLLICAESQTNFLAVAGTHSTHRRIIENLSPFCAKIG